MRLILDLSRTLSRATHPVPTGIDRVEMAYARWLIRHEAAALSFAACHPLGRVGTLPYAPTVAMLNDVAARWAGDAGAPDTAAITRSTRSLRNRLLLRGDLPSGSRLRPRCKDAAYLLMSHHHLDRSAIVDVAARRRNAALIVLVHDLIPLEFPEYARPNEPARHARRMETVAQLADGIVVNSAATGLALRPWLQRAGRDVPVLTALLGADVPSRAADEPSAYPHPYFVLIGTVEPRKNHLLLLHLWRRLAAELGPAAPHLVLIGRRGWENEQIVDLIERCDALQPVLAEYGDLSDAQTQAWVRGACAVLLPSFAEGYGLPVAEALAQGVPVLCSDLPALREVGGDVPEYLDPLDGLGWRQAILEYAAPGSPRRRAQLGRLAGWTPPSWDRHVAAAIGFARRVVAASRSS